VRRISIEALNASPAELSGLRVLLAEGGVVAVPTETFYGLAVDPRREDAMRRVIATKGRDDRKAFPVLFADVDQLAPLGVRTTAESLRPFLAIWPAPLTVVLPLREPIAASRGGRSLAVRIPAEPNLLRVLARVGPVTGTSANRSGSSPLNDPDAVSGLFGRELDLLLDGGNTPGGKPSTLIDATRDPPRLLRAGAYPWPGE